MVINNLLGGSNFGEKKIDELTEEVTKAFKTLSPLCDRYKIKIIFMPNGDFEIKQLKEVK